MAESRLSRDSSTLGQEAAGKNKQLDERAKEAEESCKD